MSNTHPQTEMEEKSFWFQEAAFDILQEDMAPGKKFARALVTYRAVCALASDTDSEPGPDRDGKPFQTKLIRVAHMVCQPWERVAHFMRDFVQLGLIDPLNIPGDPMQMFSLRLRLLDDPNADTKQGGVL